MGWGGKRAGAGRKPKPKEEIAVAESPSWLEPLNQVDEDRVTAYAERVVTGGSEVVGRLVRQACERHLADLSSGSERGLVWHQDRAQHAINFFRDALFLPENTDADDDVDADDDESFNDPRPFQLQPWQEFIVGSLFGWYTAKGFRRFREAYIETAKGSGKTPLGAGIMLYLLVADRQRAAQVFLAAVTREQAGIAWRDVLAMVDASPSLREMVAEGRRANQLTLPEDKSFLKPVSSEKRGLDGKRVHGALVDELHEHATPIVVNKMRAGTKGQRNALIVKTTNSGFDRTSVCWYHHEHSRQVLDGTVENDAWFAFICGLDPCEACAGKGLWFPSDDCPTCDSWETEGPHWLKSNPNLGVSLPWQYVRERVTQARAMPSEVSDVLRFNFCVWTQAQSRAIDMQRWKACQAMPSDEDLLASECFGCLDMGENEDFTAWGRLWLVGSLVAVKMRFWVPDIALKNHPNRPYEEWKRLGLLTVTPGDVTDYGLVRQQIVDDCRNDGITSIFYDQRSSRETAQLLQAEGIDMVPIIQGFPLSEAIKRVIGLVTSGELCHGDNKILTWMASNLVTIKNAQNQLRIAKERSPEKIDGMAALVIGVEGALVRRERKAEPGYQMLFMGGGLA
jgi:phage terminase large subunit-like protein